MKLLRDLVLLEPLQAPGFSPGGILYARPYRDDAKQWTVLAVGPGKRNKDGTRTLPQVRAGDRCLCNAAAGNRFAFDDGRVIVHADQVEMIWAAEGARHQGHVWIMPGRRQVILTEDPSPFVEPAQFVGSFEMPLYGWGEAGEVASKKAQELGYTVEYIPLGADVEGEASE